MKIRTKTHFALRLLSNFKELGDFLQISGLLTMSELYVCTANLKVTLITNKTSILWQYTMKERQKREEIKDTWSRKENRTRQKKVNPPFWSAGRGTENLGVHVVMQDLLKEQGFLYFFQNLVELTLNPLQLRHLQKRNQKAIYTSF